MFDNDLVYLVEGKYWDVALAQYVDTPDPAKNIIKLYSNGKPAKEDYLIRTLRFYKFPLGQFETEADKVKPVEERLTEVETTLKKLTEQLSTFQSTIAKISSISGGSYGL